MRFRIAAVLMLVGVVSVCGRAQVRPGGGTMLEVPFHRGVNLTGWLQAGSARQIQFTKFTKQDFNDIKSLGCDVIRLPINLHFMTDGDPNYTVDPLFFSFLDQIVDWCEELELHLILDNHTFDVDASTDVNVDQVLVPIWTQMAEHYKDRSKFLYYEVLNEPHGITDARWGQIQQKVITAIRAVDETHSIVVSGAGWGSYNNLKSLPVYKDKNLIYSFHFYDPFLFTHQGASWTGPSMEPLAGVPFPYGAGPMPACPAELKGTWIESSLNSYKNDGTVSRVKALIDIATSFRDQRQVPVFCGEFGVYMRNSDNAQRVNWYRIVGEYLEEKGIPWTMWDYHGGFGLFEKDSNELFKHDLNVPLVEALGLTAPEQTEFVLTPEVADFDIYTEYIAENVRDSSYVGPWDAGLLLGHQPGRRRVLHLLHGVRPLQQHRIRFPAEQGPFGARAEWVSVRFLGPGRQAGGSIRRSLHGHQDRRSPGPSLAHDRDHRPEVRPRGRAVASSPDSAPQLRRPGLVGRQCLVQPQGPVRLVGRGSFRDRVRVPRLRRHAVLVRRDPHRKPARRKIRKLEIRISTPPGLTKHPERIFTTEARRPRSRTAPREKAEEAVGWR